MSRYIFVINDNVFRWSDMTTVIKMRYRKYLSNMMNMSNVSYLSNRVNMSDRVVYIMSDSKYIMIFDIHIK